MTKLPAYARIALCASTLLLAAEVRAQLVGTLFTKPEEREYLDYLREEFLRTNAQSDFDLQDADIPEIPDAVGAEEVTGPVEYSFGGIMASRDGVRVLLNGRLLPAAELPAGFSLIEAGRTMSLRIAQDGKSFVLLPGQTVDVTTGTVVENFQRPQPAVEGPAPPSGDASADPSPEDPAPEAVQDAEGAPEESAGSDVTLASEGADADTDALASQAGKLGDSEVDALFEILADLKLERNTGEEPDESDRQDP